MQMRIGGSAVQSASKNGAQVAFQFFNGWEPSVAASLIAEAYSWAAAADLATALALIGGPYQQKSDDFSFMPYQG